MTRRGQERVKDLLERAARMPVEQRASFVRAAAADDAEAACEALDLLPELDSAGFLGAPTVAGLPETIAASTGLERPGTMIDRYKLLQLIGEGGFGTVFLAEQCEPVVRRVALKIIKPGMDTRQVIARFEAERQALAMMDHPNIARVLDAGATAGGRPYFVMELVRGEPLTAHCDRERLSVAQRLSLFQEVCGAVQHAHQKGIIHRDIKPSNVLVTIADGRPLPKVIDFGIAKATAGRLTDKTLFTELHQLIGTPQYMSPEQAELLGVDIDTRSDIYSLGVLLYELLAGSTPLEPARLASLPLAEVQRLIREEEPPRPSVRLAAEGSSCAKVSPGPPVGRARGVADDSSALAIADRRHCAAVELRRVLSGDLDWIVMKCLEKDRGRRYGTASALADDLRHYVRHEPVLARPPTAGYRARKFVRRNRGAVLAAGCVAVALLLGTIGTGSGLMMALSEVRRADRAAQQAAAINDFMREVLTSVEPQNRGADVRLIDVLKTASAAASSRFADHPLHEAQVRDLLSSVFFKLAMIPQARDEQAAAAKLWNAHAGPDDPRTLTAATRCLAFALDAGETANVERALADVVARAERVLGPENPCTLEAQRVGAALCLVRRDYDEAERRLLELRQRVPGDDDHAQMRILANLISIFLQRDLYDAGHAGQRRVVAKILPLQRELAERATRRFGPLSATTIQARIRLAEFLCDVGECATAEEICRSALEDSRDRLVECHPVDNSGWLKLARIQHALGRRAAAADSQMKAIDCLRTRSTARDPNLLGALCDALPLLDRAERVPEAEALAGEVTGVLREIGDGHGGMSFGPALYLARCASRQGRVELAESQFQALLAREAQATFVNRTKLHWFYACHLESNGLREAAEQHLRTAIELVQDPRSSAWDIDPDELSDALLSLCETKDGADKSRASTSSPAESR